MSFSDDMLDDGSGCEKQIFVLGSDRSGTTITKNIVSGMFGQPKLRFEPRIFLDGTMQKGLLASMYRLQSESEREQSLKWIMRQFYVSDKRGWHLYFQKNNFESAVRKVINAESDKERLIKNFFSNCHEGVARSLKLPYRCAIDDTPSNVLAIDLLVKLFPNCKIIHCIRDGREVAMSVIDRGWWGGHFRSAVSEWYRRVSIGRALGSMFPDNYIELSLTSVREDKFAEYAKVADFVCSEEDYDLKEFDAERTRPVTIGLDNNRFFHNLCGSWIEEFGWSSGF